ncbi:MAG: hypothetical protein CMP86_00510 [Gammaproteobacteria bacterium]|jgi:hypothetical protein|nr:hypothetical protein [Gammaproteobacteria bacterium]
MQAIQLKLLLSLCAVTLLNIAISNPTVAAEAASKMPPNEQSNESENSTAKSQETKKPATLKSRDRRERNSDTVKTSEQISEDFIVSMPVDI